MPRRTATAASALPSMAVVEDAFSAVGLRAPRGFDGLLRDALRLVVTQPPVGDPAATLTDRELDELRAAGLRPMVPADAYTNAVGRTAARMAAILADSGTVEETAGRLGVTSARVRQMLAERALYGIRTSDGWLVPRFQLGADAPLPGLRQVVAALPVSLHPVAFHAWFTTPVGTLRLDPDDGGGETVSPRDWLASGGPADVVARLAEAL